MQKWLAELLKELNTLRGRVLHIVHANPDGTRPKDEIAYAWGVRIAFAALILVLVVVAFNRPRSKTITGPDMIDLHPVAVIDYTQPARPEPKHFKRNAKMPNISEPKASMAIGKIDFNPDRDLIEIDDRRVWWESEHDSNDTENDHLMHVSMETPFRRLVELVDKHGGTLKVQDTYRASGIHHAKSLHKEGRAIDITCDELGLERLAKLAWAAGFDWVLYEAHKKAGWHVHASVRPVRDL